MKIRMGKIEFKSLLLCAVCCVLCAGLCGCTVRTYKKVIKRVDLEAQGNRGYIMGSPELAEPINIPRERTVQIIELEIGQRMKPEEPIEEVTPTETSFEAPLPQPEKPLVVLPPVEEPTFTDYKVKKGDTLQKISKKFYGSYRYWKKIFEANRERINDPNRIKPGIILRIPE